MTSSTIQQGKPATRPGPPSPLSQQETITDLLAQSGRGIVPIRKTFVQQGKGADTKPGPLASFVTSHDGRALDAYLLVHALASAEPWDCDYPAGTWVRALGLTASASPGSARTAVSKTMKRLEDRGLIQRSRSGRRSAIRLLREDGTGEPYDHPHKTGDARWLQLPHAYWHEEHHMLLSLPAKALLLVALSLGDGFYLPSERAPNWYGLSPDTAERGLRELRNSGLLHDDRGWIKDQRSATGWTERWTYTLEASFSREARSAAASERKGRAAAGRTTA